MMAHQPHQQQQLQQQQQQQQQRKTVNGYNCEDSIFRDNASEASAGSPIAVGVGSSRCRTLDSTGTVNTTATSSRPSSSSYRSERSRQSAGCSVSPVRDASAPRRPSMSHQPPQRQPPQRQNAITTAPVAEFHFDESEYDIVHSNAVETTEMTPFYPQPRLRLPRRSGAQNHECSEDCECDSCSLISSSAASCRSRKSRKSSASSASRMRRDARRSAAAAAAVAAGAAAIPAASATSSAAAQPPVNIFANIRGLFTKWLRETKASGAAAAAATAATPEISECSGAAGFANGGVNGVKAQYLNIACPQYPQECSHSDLQHAHNVMSMSSSFDSDYLLNCYTSPSACSSTTSDLPSNPYRTEDSDQEPLAGDTQDWGVQLDYDFLQRRNPRQAARRLMDAATARSWSLQSQTARRSNQKDLLCSTWPPSGWRLGTNDEEDYLMSGTAGFQVVDSVVQNSRGSFEIKEFEFNIPYDGIVFQDCLLKGKRRKVFRGQWHGDVTIHTYESLDCKERSKFWEELAKLSLIRHENIFLFMGASMDPPTSRFAVVTCQRKGQSLYDTIHVHREKLGSTYKLAIIRDLAQAAGYLHAKGILIRRFNSHNVFLEPRAKLSLQDYSVIIEDEEDRPSYLVVPASLIWYTPPEILTQLADKTSSIPDSAFTSASDAFAFSVIMYEVCSGRYPYSKCDRRQYMDFVCQGKRDTVQDLRVPDAIKCLIAECWSHDPLYRPEFSQINAALHNRETSHLWHSSSEPENLHRLRFVKNGFV